MQRLVAVPEDFRWFDAAVTNQTQPESSPSLMGSVTGGLLPVIPLTPGQASASCPGMELGVVGVSPEVADRSREGPFDIHQDQARFVASPRLLQDTQGCLFRMTLYDVESDGPNFAPEHGVQLHDPRLLEYVGAPESARLSSRSPEYWVHHMGRDRALSAAATHYMMAMGLWRPPVDSGVQTPLPSAACNACTCCQDCFPDVPM